MRGHGESAVTGTIALTEKTPPVNNASPLVAANGPIAVEKSVLLKFITVFVALPFFVIAPVLT